MSLNADLHNWIEDTLAVVVLYGVQPDEAVSIQSLGASLEASGTPMDLFIYDNSPTEALDETRQLVGWAVQYTHDVSNPGVSAAYNAGAALAAHLGKRWVLLLDQDTVFAPSSPAVYAEACDAHPSCRLFAPVLACGEAVYSPCRLVHGRGRPASDLAPGLHPLAEMQVLNSGLLVSTLLFESTGGYDPAVRLDFSDFVFLHRASRDVSHLCLLELRLEHDLSSHDRDRARVLRRFQIYCEGARAYSRLTGDRGVFVTMLLRSVRIALRLASVEPVQIAWGTARYSRPTTSL